MDLAQRSDANYFEAFRRLGSVIEGGVVHDADGVLTVVSGLPVSAFNVAFVTRPGDLSGGLAKALRMFDERSLPFCVRVPEGGPGADEAAALGLYELEAVPGMAVTPIPEAGAPPDGLHIRSGAAEDHVRVAADGFGLEPDVVMRLIARAGEVMRLFVGYEHGRPVASSAVLVHEGTAGVYNVATVPGSRRRGLGAAMTLHALRWGAAHGAGVGVLQTSAMGRPVYERLGFVDVRTYRTFGRLTSAEDATRR